MKFTNPDGRPVRVTDESTPKEESTTSPQESMVFHGDTTQIDTRKGTPVTLEETRILQEQQEKKKHGCFFRWCMTVLGLFVLLILLIVGGVFALKQKVTPYLGEKALPIPAVEVDPTTLTETTQLVEQLKGKQAIPAETSELVFSNDQINQYLEHYQATHNIPGKIFVLFPANNNVALYGSVPLGKYTAGIFKDKRLNPIVQFSGSYHNNLVDVQIVKILMDGKEVTSLYHTTVGTLTIQQPNDLETRTWLQRFENIYASGNNLHFVLK